MLQYVCLHRISQHREMRTYFGLRSDSGLSWLELEILIKKKMKENENLEDRRTDGNIN